MPRRELPKKSQDPVENYPEKVLSQSRITSKKIRTPYPINPTPIIVHFFRVTGQMKRIKNLIQIKTSRFVETDGNTKTLQWSEKNYDVRNYYVDFSLVSQTFPQIL